MLDAGLKNSGNIKWLLRGQNLITLLHLMQMHKRRIEQSFYHYIALFLSIDRIYEKLKGFWRFCTKKSSVFSFIWQVIGTFEGGQGCLLSFLCVSVESLWNFPYFCNGILLQKLFWPTVRKIILVIEINFWNSRLKAENLNVCSTPSQKKLKSISWRLRIVP